MPTDSSTPTALPIPSPRQSTRRLIRLSSLERLRLSTLNITTDSETEPPPKPPRTCLALARQALESSFVGWGLSVPESQGNFSSHKCADWEWGWGWHIGNPARGF
jgi:hypothetical protein